MAGEAERARGTSALGGRGEHALEVEVQYAEPLPAQSLEWVLKELRFCAARALAARDERLRNVGAVDIGLSNVRQGSLLFDATILIPAAYAQEVLTGVSTSALWDTLKSSARAFHRRLSERSGPLPSGLQEIVIREKVRSATGDVVEREWRYSYRSGGLDAPSSDDDRRR